MSQPVSLVVEASTVGIVDLDLGLRAFPLALLAARGKFLVGVGNAGRGLDDDRSASLRGVLGPCLGVPPAQLGEPERVWIPARRHAE